MSANMPHSSTNLTCEREPLLANANQASTPCQASTLNPPSAAGAAFHRAPSTPHLDSGAATYKKSGVVITAALLLAITFWLYAKPDVIVMLAEQMWSCF
jgi:hypothetical protein